MPYAHRSRRMFRMLRELEHRSLLTGFNNYTGVFADEPQFHFFNAEINQKIKYSDGPPLKDSLTAAGVSATSPEEAMAKCLGEAIERLSLTAYRRTDISESTYGLLVRKGMSVLDPARFPGIDPSMNNVFGWVKAVQLHDCADSFVPAQLVYLNYVGLTDEPALSARLSTGAAGDFSLERAVLKGVYEIAERDAFMTSYLLRVKLPRVKLNSLSCPTPAIIEEQFRRYRLSSYVLDMTNDLDIPAYLTVLKDESGFGPPITIGLKADYDRCRAIEGSMLEAFSPRPWLRMRISYGTASSSAIVNPSITTFTQRAEYWRRPTALKSLNFLITQTPQALPDNLKNESGSLARAVKRFDNLGYDLWFVRLSNEVLESTGYHVVKVISPDIHPLYLKETERIVYRERLRRVAKHFNLPKLTINPIPHPFL